MGHPKRHAIRAVLAMFMVALARSATATALDGGDQTATVRIDNEAAVPASSVQFAENRAEEVFGRIGARVIWIDEDTAFREHLIAQFTVVLVSAEKSDAQAARLEDALGMARPQVHRAYVFYDRIAALNAVSTRGIPSILGDVIAHELGHLLLAAPSHSLNGIMRPGVNMKLSAIETFTKSQGVEIRAQLRETP